MSPASLLFFPPEPEYSIKVLLICYVLGQLCLVDIPELNRKADVLAMYFIRTMEK